MTHPGVGPVTALATEVFLGDARRFVDGKALASYVGLIPRWSDQTRQPAVALPVVRSRCSCGASRSGVEAFLPPQNWFRKVWGKLVWRWPASWGSACGSCCGTKLITKSSVVADRSNKAVQPVRGSLKSRMVRSHRPID